MQVVITAGHPDSAYRVVHQALEMGGVQTAQPSRREGLTPEALIAGAIRAHGIEPDAAAEPRQLTLGKVWEDLAIDLFLGNLRTDNWGWADAGAAWLLDFWLRFDEQTRFVLVYASPAATIADMMLQSEATTKSLCGAVESWMRWNAELLRFSSRNSRRCVLVNSAAALRLPGRLIYTANEVLNTQLAEPTAASPNGSAARSALTSFLMSELAGEFSDAFALYEELESAAHLHDGQASTGPAPAQTAWVEYLGLLANQRRAQRDLDQERARSRRVELELQSVVNARQATDDEVKELRTHLERSQRAVAGNEEREAQLLGRNAALVTENELLFLQLQQLQEALEETTGERRRDSAADAPAPDASRVRGQLSEMAVDMRREIDGTNWYWPEHDGRWAGPDTHSTLRVPAMGAGSYEVNLEVVDAMDPEIIEGMRVTLCGVELSLTRVGKKYPAVLKGIVAVNNATMDAGWDVSFQFPKLISPAEHGAADRRQLAIRLRTLRLRAVPNGTGQPASPN